MGWKNRYDIEDAINSSGVMKDDSHYVGMFLGFLLWACTFGSITDFLGSYMPYGLAETLTVVLMFVWLVARLIWGGLATGAVYLIGLIMLFYQFTH